MPEHRPSSGTQNVDYIPAMVSVLRRAFFRGQAGVRRDMCSSLAHVVNGFRCCGKLADSLCSHGGRGWQSSSPRRDH